jgi:hypothetical protein
VLKQISLLPASGGRLIIDEYVPFRFRQAEGVLPDPYLWRTGDLKTSLLEIAISRDSHAVLGVTLICFSGRLLTGMPQGYDNLQVIEGIPVVDVSGFPRLRSGDAFDFRPERLDEPGQIRLFQRENTFLLTFGEDVVPERCVINNRIGFFEGATWLCGVGFFDLTPSEISRALSQLQA